MMQGFPDINFTQKEKIYVVSIAFKGEVLQSGDLVCVKSDDLAIKIHCIYFYDGKLYIFSEDTFESYLLEELVRITGSWKRITIVNDGDWYKKDEIYYVEGNSFKNSETYQRLPKTGKLIKKEDCKDATI